MPIIATGIKFCPLEHYPNRPADTVILHAEGDSVYRICLYRLDAGHITSTACGVLLSGFQVGYRPSNPPVLEYGDYGRNLPESYLQRDNAERVPDSVWSQLAAYMVVKL